MAVGECTFGLQRVLEAANANDRQVDRLAERGGDEHRIAGRNVHARFDHEQAGGGDADRRVDVVDLAGGFGDLRDAHRIVDGGAALDQFVAAQSHAERKASADDLAHGGHDLDEQASPVLDAAAVLIGALVGGLAEEAAHDRAVAALQLDAVEPTLRAVLGDECVAGDDLVDLGMRDGLRHLTEQRVGDCRGCPHGQAGVHAAGLAAVVVDLSEDRHPMAMDRFCDGSVARNHVAMKAVDQLFVRPVRGVRAVLFGDDQASAASRTRRVVGGVLLGRLAVACVVGEVRAEHDAVARRHRPQLQRSPQVPV